MPKLKIDNQEVTCEEGVSVLQAALAAGWDVPHYCWHPALKVVASCRLCLMEMKVPHPKTGELDWMPKLVPSCQTPVRDGMEVRFDSDKVRDNQRHCMEYFLLNHPLDCPVCDQAGECYLQDYSYRHGNATSRMIDPKLVNPKKDIGPRTLLYQDRCVMCSRCVRFTDEISGTSELTVVNRGSRSEIDVFPGIELDNPLQGNVVDICPVGSLLDKDFLFKQRVWLLKATPSICPGCSTGCSIHVEQNENQVYRLKPRYNPKVNDYWICDEGRFGWKYIDSPDRITSPKIRRGNQWHTPDWSEISHIIRQRLSEVGLEADASSIQKKSPDPASQTRTFAVVLSPMMACEEAWLLVQCARQVDAELRLYLGHVPTEGEDQYFPVGASVESAKFVIRAEKCPNRRGIEELIQKMGFAPGTLESFIESAKKKEFTAAWIVGGFSNKDWVSKELVGAVGGLPLLIAQDLMSSALVEAAHIVLPSCVWAERSGSFVNRDGTCQAFERSVNVPDGVRRDGQYLYELAGFTGLYDASRVRSMMMEEMPEWADVYIPPPLPKYQH